MCTVTEILDNFTEYNIRKYAFSEGKRELVRLDNYGFLTPKN